MRKLPRPFKMPWGKGQIIEEASFKSAYHEPCVQLLEFDNGHLTVRFAHYHNGMFQRPPLMLDAKDFARLKKALAKAPRLKKILKGL